MRNLFLFILLLVSVTVFNSCQDKKQELTSEAADSWIPHSPPDQSFVIKLPERFLSTYIENEHRLIIYPSEIKTDESVFNIVVGTAKAHEALTDNVIDNFIHFSKEKQKSFNVKNRYHSNIGEIPATVLFVSGEVKTPHEAIHKFFFVKDTIYILSFTFAPGCYSNHKNLINEVSEQFNPNPLSNGTWKEEKYLDNEIALSIPDNWISLVATPSLADEFSVMFQAPKIANKAPVTTQFQIFSTPNIDAAAILQAYIDSTKKDVSQLEIKEQHEEVINGKSVAFCRIKYVLNGKKYFVQNHLAIDNGKIYAIHHFIDEKTWPEWKLTIDRITTSFFENSLSPPVSKKLTNNSKEV